MPNKYELVVTALETLLKDLTLNFVKNRLLEEEMKTRSTGVTKKKGDLFNMVFSSRRNFPKEDWNNKNKNRKFPFKCHKCELIGYKKVDCRTRTENFRKNVSSKAKIASKQFENLCKDEEESKSLCISATTNYESESSYFLDSGVTEHCVVARSGTHIEAKEVENLSQNQGSILWLVTVIMGTSCGVQKKEKRFLKKILFLMKEDFYLKQLQVTNEAKNRIFENINLSEICVKNGEDEVAEDIESRKKYKVESRLEDKAIIFRRSKGEKQKPSYLNGYAVLALNAESFVNNVPRCYKAIETRQDKQEWFQAVQEEIESLKENETWKLIKLPSGRKFLKSKWVFKIKEDKNGNVERYKARLVIKGCAQRTSYDYEGTYAPAARLTTLRTLISVIKEKDLHAYVKYNFVRDLTEKGVVDGKYVCTNEQVADISTKPLSSEQFLKLRLSSGLMKVEGVLEKEC
ncbi:hypothetical protein ILUMI_19234 [Ignelater luminosus]|uniref:Reverse transcriptase Ty1/copia-type domain-containing protein n=1 Tax=Ignelater luminosus TaxID=2038154 RepID=A0A8K0CM34_IGNLU|nr:hypothetical protein ILUMI_19234 [Ignelater luminosus]